MAVPFPQDPRTPGRPGATPSDALLIPQDIAEQRGDDEEFEYLDDEDGGMTIRPKVQDKQRRESEFYSNLADDYLDEIYLMQTGLDLGEKIERDKEARRERDKKQAEGLRRTGLGNDAPGGAQFTGASRTVHPGFIKACIDFGSRCIKEMYPPNGPVKHRINGKATPEKMERAERKSDHMNWQLRYEVKEYRAELEQCLTQVPIGGSQYMMAWYDKSLKRNRVEFVPVDYVHIPYAAANFASAERKTIELHLTEIEFNDRVRNGMYRDVEAVSTSGAPSTLPEQSASAEANEKIEGKAPTGFNDDGTRTVYQSFVIMECKEDKEAEEGRAVPYIIHMDDHTGKILAWYRNWEEDDDTFQEIEHTVEFPMIPWRGAYAIGLPHIIGSLSGAQTGAVRALLDSAHINNAPTLLKLKGAKIGGQSQTVNPTGITEIDGGMAVNDIRQIAMPMPFNPPSMVLFQLLGYLDEQLNSTVRTSMDDSTVDSSSNVPVGTQLSRVEQGLMVFSSIFARLHEAQERLLRILHRLNRCNLAEKVKFDPDDDEIFVYRKDYDSAMDVGPVSDPNIFSESQRLAQMQAVDQIDALNPGIINKQKKVERQLKLLKIPDPDELLMKPPEPEETNPVVENMRMSMGSPASAFPDQDHLAHLQNHLAFMEHPMLGMSPIIAPTFLPAALEHVKQHICMYYVASTVELIESHVPIPIKELMDPSSPELRKPFDRMLAAASNHIMQQLGTELQKVPDVVQKALKMVQDLQPKPPMDPVAMVAAEDVKRKTAADQNKAQLDGAKTQLDAKRLQAQQEKDARDAQLQEQKDEREAEEKARQLAAQLESEAAQRATDLRRQQMADGTKLAAQQMGDEVKVETNTDDNRTALEIAHLEVESGERVAVSNGRGIGKKD